MADPIELSPRMRVLLSRLLLVTVVLGTATPAEALVPVLRTAGGRRGVHLGPAIASLLAVAAAIEVVERPPGEPRPDVSARRADAPLLVPAAVLPVLAALVPQLVVLPRRSPLWGWAVSAGARLAVATVLSLGNEQLRRRLG